MNVTRYLLLFLMLLFFSFGILHQAGATMIDFETLMDKSPLADPADVYRNMATEYASYGVIFEAGGLSDNAVFNASRRMNYAGLPSPPLGNEWFITSETKDSDSTFYLDTLFASGVHEVMGDVVCNADYGVTATAYNFLDVEIESQVFSSQSHLALEDRTWFSGSFAFLSSTEAIHRIRLESSAPYAARAGLDNLIFDPVPEPSTVLLFAFGLLTLAGVNRRKK